MSCVKGKQNWAKNRSPKNATDQINVAVELVIIMIRLRRIPRDHISIN